MGGTDHVRRHSVKVKVFEIFGTGGPDAEQVEKKLQAWLRDNPSAKIEHVAQAPLAIHGTTNKLIVTIFYRD